MSHLVDAYFDDWHDAVNEAHQRRPLAAADDMIVKVERSPYKGWRVRAVPVEMWAEAMALGAMGFVKLHTDWSVHREQNRRLG
jgi:hypothetical protein